MSRTLIFLVVIVALFYLQTILSSVEDKRIGYILPVLTFAVSIFLTIYWADKLSVISFLFTVVFTNIPTYILLIIQKHIRKIYKDDYPKHQNKKQ